MKNLKKKKEKLFKKVSEFQEFEKNDLGETLTKYKSEGRWVKPRTRPTSIALSEETILTLREKAAKKGIGYQTLLKMIVQEHLSEY